jgi:predicted oxidoreductase
MPLIAIRESILSRKTLGGIQTDLGGRVMSKPVNGNSEPIPGLYAIGEAAGFGGGGSHGKGALEGTFLGGCVLTARIAAKTIVDKKL